MKHKLGNINFILVGAKATGKTVYLTSLFLKSKIVTTQNEKTMEYLKPLANTLLNGKCPPATASGVQELIFNYKDKDFSCTIQIDDLDGHFIETLSEKDINTQKERDLLIENLKLSKGLIFFFPYRNEFDDELMKDFSYQIDTIISKLKDVYNNSHTIPIPVVIAISKWDESPYFKNEDETLKAKEYIDSEPFLCKAKEKIVENFSLIEFIPISSIGKNIENLEPYNIENPLNFFLKENYSTWEKKFEELKSEGRNKELYIFLSEKYINMKSHPDQKYANEYKKLEGRYYNDIMKKVNNIKTIDEFIIFEKDNKDIIEGLLPKHKQELSIQKEDLIKKKKVKLFSISSLTTLSIASIIIIFVGWNANKLLKKSESELFSLIETEYKTNNYTDALDNIEKYQEDYNKIINLNHKNRVIEIKSLIGKAQIITKAKSIIEDDEFTNIDTIENLYSSFSSMGIDEPRLTKELIDKKQTIIINNSYRELIDELKKKRFEDAILFIERNWKDKYGERNRKDINEYLDKHFNKKVEYLLKDISDIYDVSEYNNLLSTLDTIESLKNNQYATVISYIPKINRMNQEEIDKKNIIKKRYSHFLKKGIMGVDIYFGSKNIENEPLGFKCGSEDEIILYIDSFKYNYEKSISCVNQKIFWKSSSQTFQATNYIIKVIEKDIAEDDKYQSKLSLSENDLIKLINHKKIVKDIGNGYFVEMNGAEI